MDVIRYLTFASDAELLAIAGLASWLVAAFALVAERRRTKRARLDRVGLMPWTGIFLSFAVLGGGLLFLAMPALLGGAR